MNFINDFINIIFPNVCGICGKICSDNICSKCLYNLNSIKQSKKHIYLQRNITTQMYIFKYKDIVRNNIIQYKFHDQAYKYKAFAEFIIKDKKICGFLKKYDIIIPVPISSKRNRLRGYNQSELIVMQLQKYLKELRVNKNTLVKIKDTTPQSMLNREQRKYNLKNAYEVKNSEIIKDKKVLLFDDIFTTGSTVDECARVLKNAGASEIGVLTLAKD